MALSVTPVQSATSTAASGVLTSPTLSSGATAGNLLVLSVVRSATHGIGGAWPSVSGFDLIHDSGVNNGNMAGAAWYKVAAGGETTVSFSGETNASGNWTCTLAEYSAPDAGWSTPALAVKAENEAGLSSTGTTLSSGTTAANSVAESFGLAVFCVDGNSFGTESYTNSYATSVKTTSGGRAGNLQAARVLSATGTHETTITIGTADERWGCIAVFEADAGDPPSVTLDTADATSFTTLTPTLLFTGTDPDADDIVYQVQIANNSAFAGGGVTLTFEHNSGSGVVHPNATGGTVSNGTDADGNPQVDDRPGISVTWGGGILDGIAFLVGRDETDTDGDLLPRVYTALDGTPGTDARPDGADGIYDSTDTPTPGWAAVGDAIALDNTMAETPAWRTHAMSGANRIQTVSGAAGMVIADWIPVATTPNTNTVTVLVGTPPSGQNGWIDGNSANYGVQSFATKIRIYEDQDVAVDASSDVDAGFANQDNGGDTSPFTSGDQIGYTVQSALTEGITYYWRVRGGDGTAFGAWSSTRTFTVSASGGGTYDETVALGVGAGMTQARTAVLGASMSLATAAGINKARTLDMAALVALAAQASTSPTAAVTVARTLGLDAQAAAGFVGGLSVDAQVDLGGVLASLLATPSRGLTDSVALDAVADMTTARAVALSAVVSLAAEGNLSAGAQATIDRAVGLAAAAGLTPAQTAVVQAQTVLLAQAALAATGGRDVAADVSLGAQAALAAIASRGLLDAVALGASAGLSTSAALTRDALLALASQVALAADGETTSTAAVLALAVRADLTVARLSVMESSLLLGASADLATQAGAVYAEQLALAVLSTLETLDTLGLPPAVIRVIRASLATSGATDVRLLAPGAINVSLD